MAIFTDISPDPQPNPRRRWIGWTILGIGLVGVVTVALIPAPFVIEQPGPVYNTLGDVTIDGEEVPMIQIPNETTYETGGALDMLTVSIRGNRQELPSWLEIASAYFDPSKAVVPVDLIYPAGVSLEDSNTQGRVDMENSQKEAVAAALTELGYTFESTVRVVESSEGSPSDGVLAAGDVLLSVNGVSFSDVTGLRAQIAANGVDKAAIVDITRDGEPKTVSITPTMAAGADPVPIIGIIAGGDYDFPIDVRIQLENVGGPSAGMMFALGIIDKLTEGELNGGENIAGTGTISGSGEVGPIGGIQQKLYGARSAGASWFLAPASNCNEVTGHIPDGLTVFSIATLDEALDALTAIESGTSTSSLPTCPVS
ncbi:PDZ domain-containing protein [Salinibacterium sp. CAN_S4]|uniref:YlbL family protein n=1 Tax=Salinibacterium sp. CAN_S4 TaxID=2787727 RepID=UPI0018EFFD8E